MTSSARPNDPSQSFVELAAAISRSLDALGPGPLPPDVLSAAKTLSARLQAEMPVTEAESPSAEIDSVLSMGHERFDALIDAMPQMVWSTRPDGFHDYFNTCWYEFTGIPMGSTDGDGWVELFHPDDQALAWSLWRRSLASGELYEVEYRLRHHSGEYRWVVGRALPVRDRSGIITRWMGTCTDIDRQKRAVESTELLSRELSHRIKNIFAIVNGLIMLSVRKTPAALPFATELQDRIAALGRVHQSVRPQSDRVGSILGTLTLHATLRELFTPYLDRQARVLIEGDDVPVDDKGATPLSLIFHELATNAAKYGALSVNEGEISIETQLQSDRLRIIWTERGGPTVAGPPAQSGFGSHLTRISAEKQLGGTIDRRWHPEGLQVELTLQPSRLVHGPSEDWPRV